METTALTTAESRTGAARELVCPVCHNEEHPESARFCMICGSPLEGCQGCVHERTGRDQDNCWNCSRNGTRTRTDLYKRRG